MSKVGPIWIFGDGGWGNAVQEVGAAEEQAHFLGPKQADYIVLYGKEGKVKRLKETISSMVIYQEHTIL